MLAIALASSATLDVDLIPPAFVPNENVNEAAPVPTGDLNMAPPSASDETLKTDATGYGHGGYGGYGYTYPVYYSVYPVYGRRWGRGRRWGGYYNYY